MQTRQNGEIDSPRYIMSRRFVIPLFLYLVCCKIEGFTARQLIHPVQNGFFELSIIHLNDFHARFVQTNSVSNACRKGEEAKCIGGLARIATVSRKLLEERPNPIFLNAGDNYQGTMWYNLFKWNSTVHFMNKLHFDATTLGNHEFDDGVAGLVPFLQRVREPVVVSNIDDSQEPTIQGLYEKSTVLVRGGRKIGIIGVVSQSTQASSRPGKLKFLDEVESVNAETARLKAKGIDIIIVLSHVGLENDREIAENCPIVDVIVGGHSHSLLYTGKPPIGKPRDEYPVVVKQKATNRTVLIVQAASYTLYLGNLTVWFDRQGEVADWEGKPIFMDNSIEEDPEMLEELKPWVEAVEAVGKEVVGESRSFLNGRCYNGECNMANLITDAVVNWYKRKVDSPKSWTYAAVGCINAAGVRSNIPAGPITYGDLKTVQPFENTWDVVEIKGADLCDALEESVSRARPEETSVGIRFLHWSGIRVVYNMSMPAWSRIQSLSVRCQACEVPKYELLNRDEWYRVATMSYIADGKDDIKVIAGRHRNRQTGPLDIDVFEEYVKFISPFTYEPDQRVQLIR